MKELSIQEKAHLYDEAIERANELLYVSDKESLQYKTIKHILPYLNESDEERIRKELLEHCRNLAKPYIYTGNKYPQIQSWIAWLEKKGKNNMGISEATKQKLEDNLNKALEKETPESCNEFLEKQGEQPYGQRQECVDCQFNYTGECKGSCAMKRGEQKPTDKVEPKFKKGDVIRRKDGDGLEWTVEDVHKDGYYTIVCADRDDFIQLDDNWELVEQKPAWSEEDEGYYDAIIAKLEVTQEDALLTDNEMDFLKSLKERVLLESTWNEEDKTKIKSIITLLKSPSLCTMDGNKGIIDESIKYLKSIKDRVLPQPKQEWSKEDKAKIILLESLCDSYEAEFIDSEYSSIRTEILKTRDWLESLKDGILPQSKQEWNEEDNPYYDDICEILINLLYSETANVNKDAVQKDLDWFNSLKDRIQPNPKQKWSEEDKRIYKSITYSFAHDYPLTVQQQGFVKSLKNRCTCKPSSELDEASYQAGIKHVLENPKSYGFTKYNWKPSEKQINALSDVLSIKDIKYDVLSELLKCLKKLI